MAKDTQDTVLPTDPAERKNIPIASGVLDYFPAAIAYIAKVSKIGNDQHNPGEPLHWARGKSMDHPDTIMRHFMERGTLDKDDLRHTGKAAWRMLALLQEELEREEGAPLPRGARVVGMSPVMAAPYGQTGLTPVIEAMNPHPNGVCSCGSTELWAGYAENDAAGIRDERAERTTDLLCNNMDCFKREMHL